MTLRIFLILTLMATGAESQTRTLQFVIDDTKPYVFIKFDHAGTRKPLSPDEPPEGLWLRLVNNCNVPLSLDTFDPGTEDQGIGVFDQIVSSSFQVGYVDEYGKSQPDLAARKPPRGYSSDVHSSTTVAPGESILFSVPRNHVSPAWDLRVQFQLEPPKKGRGIQPHSFVDFTWTMIPKMYRKTDSPAE